jgi:hypothetical protein
MPIPLAQNAGPNAATLFYITLLIIFLAAIITTVLAKWLRDKCLKFFRGYRITMERQRGQTLWGRLKVFSSGVEIVYDHPYVDPHGRRKTSYLFYQVELEQQVLSLFRYHGQLPPDQQKQRQHQVHATFNPRFFRRLYRGLRNFVNTLRDAFNAAIGAAVTQYQRANPALATQGTTVTSLGQTLLGKFANAYEPLLEQYIGQPVILEVADPLNPNNAVQEYTGYLADYTQQFIAVFNVEHAEGDTITVKLPDVDKGDPLPPLPPPPPPGAPMPMQPIALVSESGVEVRMDGVRMKIQNARSELIAVVRLEREGAEPQPLGMILPPMGTLNLPARDARGGRLVCTVLRAVDIVAPRKFATVRHAGDLLERRGLSDELALERLPLVSRLFGDNQSR